MYVCVSGVCVCGLCVCLVCVCVSHLCVCMCVSVCVSSVWVCCAGADITDYFNYGFTEETWQQYCDKQRRLISLNDGTPKTIVSVMLLPLALHQ